MPFKYALCEIGRTFFAEQLAIQNFTRPYKPRMWYNKSFRQDQFA